MKSVLITGATGGIGRSIVKILAESGYFVFAGYRKQEDILALQQLSPNVLPVKLNVNSHEDIENAFNTISNTSYNLYGIINNAGFVFASPVECMDIDKLKEQFEINTFAPIKIVQKFLPIFNEGKIINISSEASCGIFPFISPYCASKRALDIFFNSLANEFKQNKKIKIVSIKPGIVKTPIWQKTINSSKDLQILLEKEFLQKYEKEIKMLEQNALKSAEKGMNPDKIANLILKVLNSKNPKSTYNIGFDSILSNLFAKLPQDFINLVIRHQIKYRIKKVL